MPLHRLSATDRGKRKNNILKTPGALRAPGVFYGIYDPGACGARILSYPKSNCILCIRDTKDSFDMVSRNLSTKMGKANGVGASMWLRTHSC